MKMKRRPYFFVLSVAALLTTTVGLVMKYQLHLADGGNLTIRVGLTITVLALLSLSLKR